MHAKQRKKTKVVVALVETKLVDTVDKQNLLSSSFLEYVNTDRDIDVDI